NQRARTRVGPVADHLPQRVRVERRPVDETESRRANGPDCDRYADEYQATLGDFLGDTGFVWGPEGLSEDQAGVLGDVAGAVVLGPHALRRGRRRERPGRLRRAPSHAGRLGRTPGASRLPDRRPAGAGVARRPRSRVGWLVADPGTTHSRYGDLRRRTAGVK